MSVYQLAAKTYSLAQALVVPCLLECGQRRLQRRLKDLLQGIVAGDRIELQVFDKKLKCFGVRTWAYSPQPPGVL